MRRRLTILAISACTVAATVAAGYHFRTELLTGAATAWIVNDPLAKADAILVPGGGIGWRPIEAAKLYHEGVAPRILIIDVKPDVAVQVGVREPDRDLMRAVLLKKGVPGTNIVTIGNGSTTTYTDVAAACDWARTSGAKRILITTDLFHTRRAKWIAKRILDKNGYESEVHAVAPPEYCATNWWRNEEGLITFNNEFVKYLRYRLKY